MATSFFLIILIFFDKNNISSQFKLSQTLHKIELERQYYIDEIKKNKESADDLKTNAENLEKFAREKYLMKRDSEDIFLVIDPSEKK